MKTDPDNLTPEKPARVLTALDFSAPSGPDWGVVLSELRMRGLTQKGIAAKIGACQTTISELYRGITSNPSYTVGKALECLYIGATSKSSGQFISRLDRPARAQRVAANDATLNQQEA